LKAGISVINKVKPTVATGTDGRFVLIFRQSDPNDYAVLVELVALIPTESSLFGNRNVTARRGFSAATMLFLFTPESPDCLVFVTVSHIFLNGSLKRLYMTQMKPFSAGAIR
jgi:hypothetical protein